MSARDTVISPRKFLAPEMLYGLGSRRRVGDYAKNLGLRRVLLVSDPGVLEAGWAGEVEACLTAAGIETVLFSDVVPNPRDYESAKGKDLYLREGCDGIVAVGGGSPIDCAKGIGILSENGGDIREYEGVDTIPSPCPPLICVPTTAGTSADISQFCIVTDSDRHVKMAIVSRALVPDVSLIDPEVTVSMNAALTAATGLDALTHAAEALVSNARSPLTDLHAEAAIRLIPDHLTGAIRDPGSIECRSSMMLASLYAGLAFSNASLGAVHAMAHALGGQFDTPHGESNAILLPVVVERNFSSAESGYRVMASALGIAEESMTSDACREALVGRIQLLQKDAGVTGSLADMGVTAKDLPALAQVASQDACLVTNPCDLTASDLEALYGKAL